MNINFTPEKRREYLGTTTSVDVPSKSEKIRPTRPSHGNLYPTPPDGWQQNRLYASGRIDADGRGAIGVLPISHEKNSERKEKRDREIYTQYECTRWHYEEGEVVVQFVPAWCASRFISSLELQQEPETEHTSGIRYGLKGITPYGSRRVRQSAAILERRFGKDVALYTLTIPSLGKEKVEHLSSCWSKLMNHFFIKMTRLYKNRGAVFHYVAVYEVQGKRLRDRGEYALHTHYLAPSRRTLPSGKRDWVVTADEIRDVWRDIIRAELVCLPDDERMTKASVDATPVKTSAVGYLGKYLTKGVEECQRLVEMGLTNVIPPQWWTCSKSLKAACAIWERKLGAEEIEDILYLCVNRGNYTHVFDYVSAVYANIGGREVCVGYSFKFAENNPMYDFRVIRKSLDKPLALLVP